MKKIKLIITIVVIIMSATAIFYACQKDSLIDGGGLKSHKSSEFYDQELLNKFMDERLVRNFKEQIKSFELKVYNGILQFRNVEDVNTVYDLLIEYSDEWDKIIADNSQYTEYVESERFPIYPILYAFEVINDFYSLHTHIENQLLILEAGDGISLEENDPDDHYIESPFMRVLLTPDCEIIVNNTIFIEGDIHAIEIDDLNMENLQKAQSLIHTFGKEEGMKKACLQGYAIQWDDSHKSNDCCKNIIINAESQCDYSCKLSLKNNSSCAIQDCNWIFGDGASMNAFWHQTVTHKYSQKGTYLVSADITFFDGTSCMVNKYVQANGCYIKINR